MNPNGAYLNDDREPSPGDEVLIGRDGPLFVVREAPGGKPLQLWAPVTQEKREAMPGQCTLMRPFDGWNPGYRLKL